VRDAHPSAALSDITSMDAVITRTIAEPRVLAWVLGAFALVGLVVACAGVFAVTSYGVGTRTGEFGLRMALGATPRDVLTLVLRGGVTQVAPGLVLGAAGAAAAGRLVEGLLFRTGALDFVSIAGASVSIAVAALVATLLPAARAARVDPLMALRDI
jgi:ABC-type antimicrobial peptide transport system permease subunit